MDGYPVVILAGGRGTRIEEATKGMMPKPLLEIGDISMLAHIIGIYKGQGFDRFFIAAGYLHEQIDQWRQTHQRSAWWRGEEITIVDTGAESQTGGRIGRLAEHLGERFMLTYGDGVSDINLRALLDFHSRAVEQSGVLVTLTAVRPPSRFGALRIEDGIARVFAEKPQAEEGWVNGGFYVVEPEALRLIAGDATMWEYDVLPVLAQQGRLAAFQHAGFWQCVDMPREQALLDELFRQGKAPWARWLK